MNWLPVVNRELRVAARKRSTFWLRVAAALTALVIGSAFLLLSILQGTQMFALGSALFAVLTWLCLAAGLSAGLFFTSDCLSEEKREGTLGLLFLTDLRGYDVALGKLLATSLRGFYALLAVLPVLAITLLMGGVTAAEFWKSALALVNALFFSLAAGMLVSALSRDSQKALLATLFLLLLLAAGGPIADAIISAAKRGGFEPFWSLSSPGYVLAAASAWSGASYWSALAVTQLLGWAMLAAASALVPHTWQEKKKSGVGNSRGWSYAWRYGGARRRLRLRQKLIGQQPVAWLVCRERWQSVGLWSVTILILGGFGATLIDQAPMPGWNSWIALEYIFWGLVYLWAASQACRFPLEARRSGLLELLLATPLTERQIVAGQWRALVRLFGLPVLLLLGVEVSVASLSQVRYQQVASGSAVLQAGVVFVVAVLGAVSTAANLLALGWFGMWMGMTSRSANLATLKTILFVQIIPWFVIAFGTVVVMMTAVSGMLFGSLFGSSPGGLTSLVWWPLVNAVLSAALVVAKDIGFIVWSRKKLHSSFREQAAGSLGQPRFVAPPPLLATAAPQ